MATDRRGMAALVPGTYTFAHADQTNISPALAEAIAGLSAEMGQNIGINSGYRSPSYNRAVGGAPGSYHTRGLAADIDMTGWSAAERQQAIQELTQRGVTGFITYTHLPNMLHVDMRPRPPDAPPHFMHDKTYKNMNRAPAWFKEMAAVGGIKVPDTGPTPSPRPSEVGPMQPSPEKVSGAYQQYGQSRMAAPAAAAANAYGQMASGMKSAGLLGLDGRTAPSGQLSPAAAYGQMASGMQSAGLLGMDGRTAPAAPAAMAPSRTASAYQQYAQSRMATPATAPTVPDPGVVAAYKDYGLSRSLAPVAPPEAPVTGTVRPAAPPTQAVPAPAVTPPASIPAVAQAVAPPLTAPPAPVQQVKQVPPTVPAVQAPRAVTGFPMAPPAPSFKPADVYSGRAPMAASWDGNIVSRDPSTGMTAVTNQYGVTTGMTPGGRQVSLPGPLGGEGINTGKGILGGMFSGMLGEEARERVGQMTKGMLGGAAGAALGGSVAGPIGSMIGGMLGRSMVSGGLNGLLGSRTGTGSGLGYFPGAPSAPNVAGGYTGARLSRAERASLSPAAMGVVDRGEMTGLF